MSRLDWLLPWNLLLFQEKIDFIKSNYDEVFDEDKDKVNVLSNNLLAGTLPDGNAIVNVYLTPSVKTLREEYIKFQQLPDVLHIVIANSLSYEEVLSFCTTVKEFNKICENKLFWMNWLSDDISRNVVLDDKNIDELKVFVSQFINIGRN